MDRALYTERVHETLVTIYAELVADVYDDVHDETKDSIEKLIEVGRFLGIDFWDRAWIEKATGYIVTDVSYAAVKELVGL